MRAKKFRSLFLVPAALFTLAACSAHTHEAGTLWAGDAKEHYRACECGEKMDVGAHDQNGDAFDCSVCGAYIHDTGEEISVHMPDEYGNTASSTVYDRAGNIVSEARYARIYDDAGNMLTEKYYENIRLASESEFVVSADGESRLVKYIDYSEDGTCFVNEYNDQGYVAVSTSYDALGSVTLEVYSEYASGEDGSVYERSTVWKTPEETTEAFYNEYGDTVYRATYNNKDHRLTQQLRYEREYDESGNILWQKEYIDGSLTSEITGYAVDERDDLYIRYPAETIDYYDDGRRLVSTFGAYGDVTSETLYDADGSVLEASTHEHTYDENHHLTNTKLYENGRFATETEFAYNADGWTYMWRVTVHHEDGSRTVYEYGENEALISTTEYDA
ncbi:MAG: RHS repeat protein [Oscillospiraceae bacterium]|nr:RHS repeat protein [Oscillospiraceae bacterium]